MNKFEELKKSTSWEELFNSLDKINFVKEKNNEEIELIELEVEKFKDMDDYSYNLILCIIKIKKKLLKENNSFKSDAYFYKRELVDKLYELVLNGEMDSRDNLISSLFILDMEAINDNEISKSLLEMIRKYKIHKFYVPLYHPLDYGITVTGEHEFLINYGFAIKNLLKKEYISTHEIVVIFVHYILAFAQNLDIYNDTSTYILDGIQLIFDIEKTLKIKDNEDNVLFKDIINIGQQYLVAEYLSEKEVYQEEFEINDNYYRITKDIDDLITSIEYSESLLAANIEDFILTFNQKFFINNKNLIYNLINYFIEMSCLEEIIPLDILITICKKKIPKYKSNFMEEIILKYSLLEDLYGRKEYELVIKKYEQVYNKKLPYNKGYFEVAYSYGELNKDEKAKEVYLSCIELGQGNSSIYNNLGCIYSGEGNKEKALEYFKIAHGLNKKEKLYIDNIISVEKDIHSGNNNDGLNSDLWEDVDLKYIPESLKHLTVEEIKKLLKSYYNDEKNNNDLIDKYNLNISNSGLYLLFPLLVHKDKFCTYCNLPVVTRRPSKSSYNTNNLLSFESTCPECKHEFYKDNCNCDNCTSLREKKKKAKEIEQRIKINKVYDLNKLNPCKYENLNIYEKLYLTTLAREGLDEDLKKIQPVSMFDSKLAPTNEYAISIVKYLTNNIIKPHPDSLISAFEQGEDFPNTYYINNVYYHINLTSDKYCNKELLQRILNPMSEDIVADIETLFNIWIEIAIEECKENLTYNMGAVGFNYTIGEKTEMLFKDLLNNFSLGQIFYMNYKGANDSLRFHTEKNVTRKHASNTVVGNIRRYAERVIANGWDVTNYNRPYETPQTAISEIFFNRYLKIEQRGFYEKPSIEIIKERRN